VRDAAKKLTGGFMERRSPYRNPLLRLEGTQPAKTFKVFSSAGSAAHWLKEPKNAERCVKDARGKIRLSRWADGRVAITYFGRVDSGYRLNLAPERRLTPELWALENRRSV
jgi:hypothetical protein